MILKNNTDIPEIEMKDTDVRGVTKKVLIGPDDGSEKIIMRHFRVDPGGNTPYHSHDIEHLVKIEQGRGMVRNEAGEEFEVSQGQSLFIKSGEKHQFKNPFQNSFEFLCVILNPDAD